MKSTLLADQLIARQQPNAPSLSNPFDIKDVDCSVEYRHIIAFNLLKCQWDFISRSIALLQKSVHFHSSIVRASSTVHSKLMRLSLLSDLDFLHNLTPFAQRLIYPPSKCWLLGNRILRNLHRVQLLLFWPWYPGCWTIMPPDLQIPTPRSYLWMSLPLPVYHKAIILWNKGDGHVPGGRQSGSSHSCSVPCHQLGTACPLNSGWLQLPPSTRPEFHLIQTFIQQRIWVTPANWLTMYGFTTLGRSTWAAVKYSVYKSREWPSVPKLDMFPGPIRPSSPSSKTSSGLSNTEPLNSGSMPSYLRSSSILEWMPSSISWGKCLCQD